MPLETATHISDFVLTNPDGTTDTVASLDNHFRMMKTVLQTDFPNINAPVTATPDQLNGVSPAFTGTPTAPTAAVGTATTQIATTAFVAATSLVSALPGQTGNSGKIVTTDGTNASWTAVKTINSTSLLGSGDIVLTSGMTLLATLTPTAAANVDALSTFTSSYDNYLILLDGIKPATTNALLMRLATAGAADTGSNYWSGNFTAFPSAGTSMPITYSDVLTTGKGVSACVTVLNANDATGTKGVIVAGNHQLNAVPTYEASLCPGSYVAANTVSGVRFYWGAGANFSATGKIRIYGYNNT